MPTQTIACIFVSKIKLQIVAVKLFQVENFFHQSDSKFTWKSIKCALPFFCGKLH